MTDISRRRLLEGTLAGGAIALTGVAQARTSDEPKQWDATYDVIVIGSGFAGLAAALEAKKAGANVVVLEKMVTPRAAHSKRCTALKTRPNCLKKTFWQLGSI